MSEEDIKNQLKEKNKEIYLNKLNLDLTNNFEVLVLSIDNILDNISNDTKNKVLNIAEGFQKENLIKKYVNKFIDDYRLLLMNLLDNKKKNIELLFNKLEIKEYKDKLKDMNTDMFNDLDKDLKNNINILVESLSKLDDDNFYKKRIKDYIEKIFVNNLNKRLMNIINDRDLILLNTFKESYLKYLELNKNTIGS